MKTPDVLYKYRDFHNEYNKRILFNFEIFLPSTTMFNDPYEGSIPFIYNPKDPTDENLYIKMREVAKYTYPDWSDQQIEEYCFEAKQKDLLNDPKHMKEQLLENRRKIDETFGILSLTPKYLNYLMWSHYGNSHKGFCIGFDSEALFETIEGSIGPVDYQEEIPKMDLFGDTMEFFVKQLSTKSKVWEYEEEYRIVKADGSKTTVQIDKNIIKHIVLGCKMKHEEKVEIIEFAISEKIPCIISELKLNLETFKLDESIVFQ
ncbi:DUF2971 domain-containing protein [Algoriphagus namhaensis]